MTPFITLEGGEGVGKTTQMRLLSEQLPLLFKGRIFTFTREPGGTPFADLVRALILSNDAKDADGRTMFGLFVAARAEHLRRTIEPALAQGKTVVSDRFVAATFAYQVYAQDRPVSEELFDAYFKSLSHRPALTIVLDMDPALAQVRVQSRQKSDQVLTHFDARPQDFHVRLREGYQRFAKLYDSHDHRVALIDASSDPETVHEAIMTCIKVALPHDRP